MTLSHNDIFREVREQLAVDLNCLPVDFDHDGILFFQSKENPGRRPFLRGDRHFDMLTTGNGIIVSATADILPFLKNELEGKNREEAFEMPFVYGSGVFFLPDDPHPLPLPPLFEYEIVEKEEIPLLYKFKGFGNAIQYDVNHPRPDVLAMTARKNGIIAGIAGASDDCKMLWQIGIDVVPEYRRCGLASALTNHLAIKILEREKIPYYGTASSNVISQRVAFRAGFKPAWVCAWRGRFDGLLTEPSS